MFKGTRSSRKSIFFSLLIGLCVLTMGPCVSDLFHTNKKESRYNLAKTKVEELADYDGVKGMSSVEWMSVYKQLGVHYEIENPKKLTQENLDNYLLAYGYSWEDGKYTR